MKKIFAILFLTMLSVSAFASSVPADKLDSYKAAVGFALANAKLTCTMTPSDIKWIGGMSDLEALKVLTGQATSAEIDDSGSQPVLIFRYKGYYVQSVAITTSDDYKSIVAVEFSQYTRSSRQVNIGTLVKPNIVTQDIQLDPFSASCK
ncbi:MAG TPA: hypothetical protein VN132_15475 [Bdellovibrio sp.]|nr:hypothetical protein [Bdellovibrio sp.]